MNTFRVEFQLVSGEFQMSSLFNSKRAATERAKWYAGKAWVVSARVMTGAGEVEVYRAK